jgi:mono/diheme cytochrome c family protein
MKFKLWLAVLVACQGGLAGPVARAESDPQIDPSCSAPSRFNVVGLARAEAAQRMRTAGQRPVRPLDATPLDIGLEWDAMSNLPRLLLPSQIGQPAEVEASPMVSSPNWQRLLTVNLPEAGLDWLDWTAGSLPQQFYRLTLPQDDPNLEPVDDFLLLDQDGEARELYYPRDLKALVVAAAGDGLAGLDPVLAALRPFSQQYRTNDVQFWILLNDPAATRSNVAHHVQASGIDARVLLDPDGLGTLALQATHAGEVAVIQPPAFVLAYRGQLDLASETTHQPYLAAALTGLTQGKALTYLRTPLTGPALAVSTAPVPSYATDVAPILHEHCAICHRPNDVAPFAMTDYASVASWAPAIKQSVLANEMPPWHVDPAYGHWTNGLALAASDRMTLVRWVNAGAPRGDGSDPLAELPLPPSYSVWPADLGPPDAIVTPGMQSVKLGGIEPYRYLFVQSPNPSNVWLRAAIILPSNPAIVHHYLVWTGKVGNQSPLPNVSTYNDPLAGYVPGVAPYVYPADSGYLLGKSNWLTFNLHYTPNGQITNDLPRLALWYCKTPPPKSFHTVGPLNLFFQIPPGAQEYPVSAPVWSVDHDIRLERLNPHMHLRGKRVSYAAIYPDGTQETLLSVPDYNFRWQTGYQLAQPKILPAGTQIVIQGAFDNSDQNLANPNPTATVTWGDQTSNEMFVGFFDYVD